MSNKVITDDGISSLTNITSLDLQYNDVITNTRLHYIELT